MPVCTTTMKLSTQGHAQVVDLTNDVKRLLADSGLSEGAVTVFVPGSTGAVTTIEYEPGLVADVQQALERLIPQGMRYAHNELNHDDNGHSHVRAGFIGPSLTVPFEGGRLMLGAWQQIVLLDLDSHPRSRRVVVQVHGE